MPTRLLLIVIIIACSLTGCDYWAALLPTVTPPPPPASATPQISVEVDSPVVAVGATITVRFQVVALGMPQFYFALAPGEALMVPYGSDESVVLTPEPALAPFVITSSAESLTSGVLTLLAVNPGSAELTISASGEGGLPGGPFYWTSVQSAPILLQATAALPT